MGRRLKDSITSDYLSAANRLNSRQARHRIVAYVESYDDVFFWRTVLSSFETDSYYFQVMLPSRSRQLNRGKKAALMRLMTDRVGSDMIACVDADYDYLEQGASGSSKTILNNPYIFHSYAYAIENMQCYAPSLHAVCVAVALNDRQSFDFEAFLRDFSTAIFPLFVWNIWSYRTGATPRFAISDFLHIIEMGNISPENSQQALVSLRRRVGHKVQTLQRQHPGARESYAAVKDDLRRLGVRPDMTYMYIQGHHLFDKIVVPLVRKVCNQLIREREREISAQSVHATQQRNELSCYSSSVGEAEFVLRRNVGYVSSPQYQSIVEDLQRYLEEKETSVES